MNYIIVGKNIKSGSIDDDSSDLQKYFELGWEIVTTRLKLILMLKNKEINVNDTIVTFSDRAFLYTNLFKNVIDYKYYLKIKNKNNTIDLVSKRREILKNKKIYKDIWQYKGDVLNVNYSNFDISEKFIGLLVRKRSHAAIRNINDDYNYKFLNQAKIKNIKVFVFGMGSEYLCDNKNSFHVGLRDWASLMHNKNCMCITGGTSGGLMLGQVCCTNKMLIIDHNKIMKNKKLSKLQHPLYAGKCVHFSNVPLKYYYNLPNLEEILYDVENYYDQKT